MLLHRPFVSEFQKEFLAGLNFSVHDLIRLHEEKGYGSNMHADFCSSAPCEFSAIFFD